MTIKAKATATVVNGMGETSTLNEIETLSAGEYTVRGEYLENDTYENGSDTGTLVINKKPTITNISSDTEIVLGEALTINIVVTHEDNIISSGTVTILDGENIIQSNLTVTGNDTMVTFQPNSIGTHTIKAVYHDQGNTYDDSESNVLHVTVNKKTPVLNTSVNALDFFFGEAQTITGNLTYGNNGVSGQNIRLIDYDNTTVLSTTTTDSDGAFSFSYDPEDWGVNGEIISVEYAGTDEYNPMFKLLHVTLQKHDVFITTYSDLVGYTDDILPVPLILTDEDGNRVTSGEVEVTLTPVTEDETEEGGGSGIVTPDLVPRSSVKITDYDMDHYIKFMGAKVYTENNTPLHLEVVLAVVDEDDEIPNTPGSNQDNIILGMTDTQYTITLPTGFTDYNYNSGEILLSAEGSEVIPSLLDTENGTITLTGTSETYGGTPLTWTVTGKYTIEEV